MTTNAVCVWDFTLSKEKANKDELLEKIKSSCKQWCFQLEKGKGGYEHFQGRVSLKIKSRKGPAWFPSIHWSPTSGENKDNMFYVCKEDTRIDGPWCDTDKDIYIPKQFRNIKLKIWQNKVIQSKNLFNDRIVNLIYDPVGNKGKSTVASIGELMHNGIDLPPVNDAKDLIQTMCDICMSKNQRDPGLVFLDLPRAMDKERLFGMYQAIEQVKKGKLYDMRYKYRDWWIDSPTIWVFSNHKPDLSVLSADRWKIYTITDDDDLKLYVDTDVSCGAKAVTLRKKRIL